MNIYRVILSASDGDVDFETVEAGSAKAALRKFLIASDRGDEDDPKGPAFDLLDNLEKINDWLWECYCEEGTILVVMC